MIVEQSVLFVSGFLVNITPFRMLEYIIVIGCLGTSLVVAGLQGEGGKVNQMQEIGYKNSISKRDYL